MKRKFCFIVRMCSVRNGNFLKMRVSEIRVSEIRVNQGLGVIYIYKFSEFIGNPQIRKN